MVESLISAQLIQQERIDLGHLEILLSSLGEGIIVVDAGGALLAINPAAVEMLGQQKMPRLSEDWSAYFQVYYPDGQTPLPLEQIPLCRALRGEAVQDFHLVVYTPAGLKRYLLVTAAPLIDKQGHVFGAVTAFRNLSDLIEAQHALAGAHQRLHYILRGISDGFVTVNRNWLISSINPAAQVLLGPFDEALLGSVGFWDLLAWSQEAKHELEACLNRAFIQRVPVETATYLGERDLRCRFEAYPHGDELALFIRDETEAWRHEQLLLLEKEVLTTALDEQEPLKQIIAEMLTRFEAIFSGRQSELIWLKPHSGNLPLISRYPWAEQLQQHSFEQWQATLADNKAPFIFESDGTSPFAAGQVAALPICDSQGGLLAVFVVYYPEPAWLQRPAEQRFLQRCALMLRTLIESKRQTERLAQSQQRYQIVARATHDVIWEWDLKTQAVIWSDALCSLFGYCEAERVNQAEWWKERIHPEDYQRILNSIDAHLHQRISHWQGEYRFRCADGSYHWVLNRSYVLFDEQGQAQRMIGSMQDLSLIKAHEARILDQKQRLLDIAWQQSHEFRRPLANIIGLAELLKTEYGNSPCLQHLLAEAEAMDKMMHRIVQQSHLGAEES